MSEDELKKWEGKLQLWIKLHPEIMKGGKYAVVYMNMCQSYCPHYLKKGGCSEEKRLGLFRDYSTIKEMDFHPIMQNRVYAGCVEWIKHV